MRKLTTIIGLSLVAGSALFAQGNISSDVIEKTLYPKEYSNKGHFTKNEAQTLSRSSISNNTLKALYPDDSFVYSNSANKAQSKVVTQATTIPNNVLKAMYPDDTFVYTKN